MRLVLVFSLLVLCHFSTAKELKCTDLFSTLPQRARTNLVENLDKALNEKTVNLSWHTFDALEKLADPIQKYTAYLETLDPEARASELQALIRALDGTSTPVKDFMSRLAKPLDRQYEPSEYELQKAFRLKLHEVVKHLPKEFRPHLAKLSLDVRRHRLNTEAREFVKETAKRFDEVFPMTGYRSYAEYLAALRASPDPLIKKALRIVEKNQIKVIVRLPESIRFWIPKTGFQNQYVTGSSQGHLGSGRKALEAQLTSREYSEYKNLDEELMPKYGTLHVDSPGIKSRSDGAEQYGTDVYKFKMETLEGRVTVFIGDSINHLDSALSRIRSVYSAGARPRASQWETRFIPWERRALIIPFMLEGLAEKEFVAPSSTPSRVMLKERTAEIHDYWESQIFGRVDLDMVESFEFALNPPAGEFLQELRRRNIEIIDGRRAQKKVWAGE